MLGSGRGGKYGGKWVRVLGLGFINLVGTGECVTCVCVWVGVMWVVLGECMSGLVQGLGGCSGLMYVCVCVCVMSLDYVCIWQVQVSVYCARWLPAHLRLTQCSILLHFIDICFLTCICLCQISTFQTCLRVVVGPGLVSTSPAFMRSIAGHPAGPHGWLAPKMVIGPPLLGAGGFDTICTGFGKPL